MEERQEDLPQQEETFADENATPAPGGTEEASEADVEGDDPGEEGTAA